MIPVHLEVIGYLQGTPGSPHIGMFGRRHAQGAFGPDGVWPGEPGEPLPEVRPAEVDPELTTAQDLANHDNDTRLEVLGIE